MLYAFLLTNEQGSFAARSHATRLQLPIRQEISDSQRNGDRRTVDPSGEHLLGAFTPPS